MTDSLGLSLIVGGAALLCSGLIFLIPTTAKNLSSQPSVKENLEELEGRFRQIRKDRGDPN